jgi:hypothetical protein
MILSMIKALHWTCTAIVTFYAVLIAYDLAKIEYGKRLNDRERAALGR